ncbi:hypothetical protein DPMN_157913 [Dreissena polymorpha]|uniref:Uncharacterized protein n=1 Tax=Dreissena polymorpha TaxID=45954 RepID=A0A9D4EIU6_DREPO|nr:hypothetical protein DPMN_157913 [Dreissena polymorpha]
MGDVEALNEPCRKKRMYCSTPYDPGDCLGGTGGVGSSPPHDTGACPSQLLAACSANSARGGDFRAPFRPRGNDIHRPV